MIITWKTIEGFENYEISDTGFVRNRNTQKFKKLFIRENEYFYVHLWKNNKDFCKTVHRLVALAFIENPSKLPLVDHINGDKQNNRVENLRFATKSQNNANKNMQTNNTTNVKGVTWNKQNKKFRAQIRINNKQYHLGLYESEFEAGFVFEFFSLLLFKEFSKITRKFNQYYSKDLFEKIKEIIKHFNF